MQKVMGIYALQFEGKRKKYIAASQDIIGRIYAHKSDLKKGKHANKELQKDYDLLGADKLIWNVLEEVADVNELEEALRYHFDFPYLYNKVTPDMRRIHRRNRIAPKITLPPLNLNKLNRFRSMRDI